MIWNISHESLFSEYNNWWPYQCKIDWDTKVYIFNRLTWPNLRWRQWWITFFAMHHFCEILNRGISQGIRSPVHEINYKSIVNRMKMPYWSYLLPYIYMHFLVVLMAQKPLTKLHVFQHKWHHYFLNYFDNLLLFLKDSYLPLYLYFQIMFYV